MSTSGINNVINNSGIGTGNFLIHYDFSSYSDSTHVDSVADASDLYSGQIIGGAGEKLNATGTLGEMSFYGGYSGENQYINIENSENIFTPSSFLEDDEFTFVFIIISWS